MREIHAHDVDACAQHPLEDVRVARCGSQGGDDLGRALGGPEHGHARSASAATAGSVLPSRNSRNAPPPVEMYPTRSPMPNFAMAASVSPPPGIEAAGDSAIPGAVAPLP